MASLIAHAEEIEAKRNLDFWLTERGQEMLKGMLKEKSKEREDKTGRSPSPLDSDDASRALLQGSLSSAAEAEGEFIEVELTADTGACDTVIPKMMCPGIPIVASQQSILGLAYEVANGASIPNLGERRCEIWTEGASKVRSITIQVADVHKGLLSLSRCADMGFESRFGRRFGCLIDSGSREVISLTRKGNLYMLKCWVRAAPAGSARQECAHR